MKTIPTTSKTDATKLLCCAQCPLNYNCNKHQLACYFVNQELFFSASIICILERAENCCEKVLQELMEKHIQNATRRVEILFHVFMPAIYKGWHTYEVYEAEKSGTYDKNALVFALHATLTRYNSLELFDLMFKTNIKKLNKKLYTTYTPETMKPENQL